MTILNEIRSDMRRLGFKADLKPVHGANGIWRLSLVRNDLDWPEGYYKDFSEDKVEDLKAHFKESAECSNFLAQWVLMMYIESVRDRITGRKSKRKYRVYKKLDSISIKTRAKAKRMSNLKNCKKAAEDLLEGDNDSG